MKKVQFGYHITVVGARWPSGAVTLIQGCKPLTAREVRKLLSRDSIKALKRAFSKGYHKEVAGVFVAPIGWNGWNTGLPN